MADLPNHSIDMSKLPVTRHGTFTARPRRDVTSDISRLIGKNLKEARKQSGYSLETLAHKSGVSRAMLGQIETAKSVPTVTVIWRIADALGIAIGALISSPEPETAAVVRKDRSTPQPGGLLPLWPEDRGDDPRLFEVKLSSGQTEALVAQSQPQTASLVVAKGRLRLDFSSGAALDLAEGDTAFFDAQQAAVVINSGPEAVLAYLVLHPKRVV